MFQDKHNITTVSFLLTRWDRQDTECVTLTDCLQHLSQSVKHEKLITELNNHKDNTFSGICFFFLNTLHVTKCTRQPVHSNVHSKHLCFIVVNIVFDD